MAAAAAWRSRGTSHGEPLIDAIGSVRSVPVTQGEWTKVERMGVVPFYEDIVTMDLMVGARHSGGDPPIVYLDDISLTPVSGDGGY